MSPELSYIEKEIYSLQRQEQLWLIERLIHHLRKAELKDEINPIESQLEEMAADEEIQTELKEIELEFRFTESNGLANK